MITVKRILLVLFIIFGCLVSIKAKERKEIKGILITASCDTLHGYLKKISERKQCKTIVFREVSELEFQEYGPLVVEAFPRGATEYVHQPPRPFFYRAVFPAYQPRIPPSPH